ILRKNKSDKHTQVETLYLLIALSELGKEYWLEEEVLASYFNIHRSDQASSYVARHELSYFSLTVALFYMRTKSRYRDLRDCVEKAIEQKVVSRSSTARKEAELTLLLFDVLACPHVSNALKHTLLTHYDVQEATLRQQIIDFRSPKSRHSQWFT